MAYAAYILTHWSLFFLNTCRGLQQGNCSSRGRTRQSYTLAHGCVASRVSIRPLPHARAFLLLCCVVLCCVVLCCVVFVLCLVLSCPVLSCPVLSCLALSCLVFSCFVGLFFVCVCVCACECLCVSVCVYVRVRVRAFVCVVPLLL